MGTILDKRKLSRQGLSHLRGLMSRGTATFTISTCGVRFLLYPCLRRPFPGHRFLETLPVHDARRCRARHPKSTGNSSQEPGQTPSHCLTTALTISPPRSDPNSAGRGGHPFPDPCGTSTLHRKIRTAPFRSNFPTPDDTQNGKETIKQRQENKTLLV